MKVLVTGASGFLAQHLIPRIYKWYPGCTIRGVARNEGNLIKTRQQFPELEIITGDISDPFIATKAMRGVQVVFHCAAFKHVGIAEDQPLQCVLSNLYGTINLLQCLDYDHELFVSISTDKAAQVNGVYGATKYLMERVIDEYEAMRDYIDTRQVVVRYGNVIYSTGSVFHKWRKCLDENTPLTVTEPQATRFFWTAEQAVDLIWEAIANAKDSKPYVPSMKSMAIGDLLEAMIQKYNPSYDRSLIRTIGLQPGENLHEKIVENGPTSAEVEKYTIEEIKELI